MWILYFAFQSCAATISFGNVSQWRAAQLGPMTIMMSQWWRRWNNDHRRPNVRIAANITLTRARQKQSSGPRVEQYIGAQIFPGPDLNNIFKTTKHYFFFNCRWSALVGAGETFLVSSDGSETARIPNHCSSFVVESDLRLPMCFKLLHKYILLQNLRSVVITGIVWSWKSFRPEKNSKETEK